MELDDNYLTNTYLYICYRAGVSVAMDINPAWPLYFSHLPGCRLHKPRARIVSELHLSPGQSHVRIGAKNTDCIRPFLA